MQATPAGLGIDDELINFGMRHWKPLFVFALGCYLGCWLINWIFEGLDGFYKKTIDYQLWLLNFLVKFILVGFLFTIFVFPFFFSIHGATFGTMNENEKTMFNNEKWYNKTKIVAFYLQSVIAAIFSNTFNFSIDFVVISRNSFDEFWKESFQSQPSSTTEKSTNPSPPNPTSRFSSFPENLNEAIQSVKERMDKHKMNERRRERYEEEKVVKKR